MKGVPVHLEIGPRDIENGKMAYMRRDTLEKGVLDLGDIKAVETLLDDIQANMLNKSRKIRDSKVKTAKSVDEILAAVEGKNFVKAPWCGCRECEDKIKEQTLASARVMTEDKVDGEVCAVCGKKAKRIVLFARAY